MNDKELKNLLAKDISTPPTPKDELHYIHQRIDDKKLSIDFFIQMKGLVFASIFVAIIFINQLSHQSTSTLSQVEQLELIEYYLEDSYLDNIESSYAWVDAESTLSN